LFETNSSFLLCCISRRKRKFDLELYMDWIEANFDFDLMQLMLIHGLNWTAFFWWLPTGSRSATIDNKWCEADCRSTSGRQIGRRNTAWETSVWTCHASVILWICDIKL
jgi:hypothetical protein